MNTPYAIYNPMLDRFLTVAFWNSENTDIDTGCTWNDEDKIYFVWSDMIGAVNAFQIFFGKELAKELMDCILVPVVLDEYRHIIEYMHDQNIAVRDWI